MTPGSTATATVRGVLNVPVMAVADGSQTGWLSAYPVASFTFHTDDQVADVVQTFPIDLGTGDLDALDQVISGTATETTVEILAGLKERILTARAGASRPTEPTAKGSIAVDVDGREWVRVAASTTRRAWFQAATKAYAYTWDEFEPIRVLP